MAGDPRRAAEPWRGYRPRHGCAAGERFGLTVLPAVLARHVLAVVLADLGEFAEALAAGEEGLRIAQTAGHPYSEVLARSGLGYAHLRQGDFAAATRVLEPGLALCRGMEFRLALPFVAAFLGSAYLWSGRAADAMPLLEEAVEASTAMRILGAPFVVHHVPGRGLPRPRTNRRGAGAGRAGRSAGARPPGAGLGSLGSETARRRPRPTRSHRVEQAGDAYRQALALATELGMRPLVAHCHFGLAKLYRQTSKREQAREHFTNATTMYREMDMRFWLEQAEVEIRRLA